MSVLGEYIHWLKEDYLRYGTAESGQQKQELTKSYIAQKQMINNKINSLKLSQDTQDFLFSLKDHLQDPSLRADAMSKVKKTNSKNTDYFIERFKDKLLNDVPAAALEKLGMTNVISQSNLHLNKNKIEELKKVRERIINKINKAMRDSSKVQTKALKTLEEDYRQFFKLIGVLKRDTDKNSTVKLEYGKDNKDTLMAMKTVVSAMSVAELDKVGLHGQWGEEIVKLAGGIAKSIGTNNTIEAVKSTIVGGEGTSFSYSEDNISKEVQQEYARLTGIEKNMKNGINLYQTHKSQDKIDVLIELNNGENLGISVKAYTTSSTGRVSAHLQDVDLASNLINTAEQFGNHWLNLHSLNINSVGKTLMDRELKRNIAYEALASGNMLKKSNAANAFIVLDPGKQGLYIKEISDILLNNIEDFHLSPEIKTLDFSNENVFNEESKKNRITKILLKVRANRIKVTFNTQLTTQSNTQSNTQSTT